MIEIRDVFTVREGNVRNRSFVGGGSIGLQLTFRATGFEAPARVRVFFISEAIEHLHVTPGDDAVAGFWFRPSHVIHFDFSIAPGNSFGWAAWTLPAADPRPARISTVDLAAHFREPSRFRNWGLVWKLRALVAFLTPGLTTQFDSSSDEWTYRISY